MDQLAEAGYRFPAILAASCALALTVLPLCVFFGFITRIAAALLVASFGALLITVNPLDARLSTEATYLYLAGFAALFIGGAGTLSVDRAIRRKAA